jgi:hypothetical protein
MLDADHQKEVHAEQREQRYQRGTRTPVAN